MGFNNKISLIDIETVQDMETGKRRLRIVHETELFADKQDVGLQEFYSAVGAHIQLTAVYEIPANRYHGEKYILTDNKTKQYEITRVGKGRTLGYLKLPVKKVTDTDLLEGKTSG